MQETCFSFIYLPGTTSLLYEVDKYYSYFTGGPSLLYQSKLVYRKLLMYHNVQVVEPLEYNLNRTLCPRVVICLRDWETFLGYPYF